MQTQTHVLLALALLTKNNAPKRNRAVLVGALIPDAFIYIAWAIYTLSGNSQTHIWDVLYFQNPTQFWDALFNSIPVFAGVAGLGYVLMRLSDKYKTAGQCVLVFGLAALIHIATDFPVHASDAHRHFWPLSDWRFYSPFSYWEGAHHARVVNIGESLLGFAVCAVLWRRFDAKWVRVILGLLFILYAALLVIAVLFMSGISGISH